MQAPFDAKELYRKIAELPSTTTSHGLGDKRVLLGGDETSSSVTQIACTVLFPGDTVESHSHESMEEHFIFLEGEGVLDTGETVYNCSPETYICVPPHVPHALKAVTRLKMITIGIAL